MIGQVKESDDPTKPSQLQRGCVPARIFGLPGSGEAHNVLLADGKDDILNPPPGHGLGPLNYPKVNGEKERHTPPL